MNCWPRSCLKATILRSTSIIKLMLSSTDIGSIQCMEEHFNVAVVSKTSHESQYNPMRLPSVCQCVCYHVTDTGDLGLKTLSWV